MSYSDKVNLISSLIKATDDEKSKISFLDRIKNVLIAI